MAAVSSCREVSCYKFRRNLILKFLEFAESQATSKTCVYSRYRASDGERAHYRDCPRKGEEGAGHGRSVCPESSGLHARNNGMDNGMQL